MKKCFGSMLAALVTVLCLAPHVDAQTLVPGNAYRVNIKNATGGTLVYCYRFLDGNVFEVATTTTVVLTSTGTWGTLPAPSPGPLAGTFFDANVSTPVSVSTYIGLSYIGPNTGTSTVSGTVLTSVAGTVIPSPFTGVLDPTCAAI